MSIASIETAIAAIKAGKPVIVADDENRENEGDVILSAELATQEWVAWSVQHSSGLLCAPMSNEIADTLELPMMTVINEDARSTAYTVTVDAAEGVTTGISAHDRMTTLHRLAAPDAKPTDVRRPGHVLPLRAVDGGVRQRAGHTEASVELMRLAGLRPVAMIAEIVAEDGEMMRMPGLLELGERENVPVTTIEKLIEYLNEHEPLADPETGAASLQQRRTHRRVSLKADTLVPTIYGELRMLAYRDQHLGIDHVALVGTDASGVLPSEGALVRVHSECITGEAFGSLKCECGPQLESSLQRIATEGGVVVYMRGHEGRGVGLANKLRAYALQETGRDTLDANLDLGLPADARDYVAAAEIIAQLGLQNIRLLSNNPDKREQLEAYGVSVAELVPLVVSVGDNNRDYLRTKRDRMGHALPAELD